MQFEIRSRWTGNVQFTADIECDEGTPLGIKVGLAVKWAFKSDAVLSGAVLSDAVLSDADLSGAVLSGATAIFAGTDDRGYEFYLTAGTTPNDIIIRAGCRRWGTFAAARTHFTHNYTSNGNVPEIMAKLALLESVAKARGYLTAESLAA